MYKKGRRNAPRRMDHNTINITVNQNQGNDWFRLATVIIGLVQVLETLVALAVLL